MMLLQVTPANLVANETGGMSVGRLLCSSEGEKLE